MITLDPDATYNWLIEHGMPQIHAEEVRRCIFVTNDIDKEVVEFLGRDFSNEPMVN